MVFSSSFERLVKASGQERFMQEVFWRPPPDGVKPELLMTWERMGPLKVQDVRENSEELPKFSDEVTIGTTTYTNGGGTYGQVHLDDDKNADFVGLARTVSGNGVMYEGQEKDGQPHGYGRYFFSNGTVFVGQFKNGKKHGQGGWDDFEGAGMKGVPVKHGLYVDDELHQ